MEQYIITQHVDKALVMLFKEIFDESLWADLNKGATIGSIILPNLHTARQICEDLKRKFDKKHPLDVDVMELEFKTSSNTSLPSEKYFERQQIYQDLLKDTKEPIREVSMKRTSLGHLQKVPYMLQTVRDY